MTFDHDRVRTGKACVAIADENAWNNCDSQRSIQGMGSYDTGWERIEKKWETSAPSTHILFTQKVF